MRPDRPAAAGRVYNFGMAAASPPRKSALIVDDSRTAREFLRRMLEAYALRVATAESAEAALEYLVDNRPDVIFMDHQMPGMDGLQAVKAIKENPATATIPVMMYTSQSGELYVGQARALGAVGVLPKQIKPVEVAEVLRSLHLMPGDVPPPVVRLAEEPASLPGPEAALAPADWSDLHRWLQRMLADQNRTLRQDLEATVTRLLAAQEPPPAPRAGFWPTGLVMLVLAAVAGTFFWLHLDAQARWQAAEARNVELSAALDARRAGEAAATATRPRASSAAPLPAVPAERLRELEAAANAGAVVGPDELPFGDRRRDELGRLVAGLGGLGFRGRVVLESHAGDFCVVRTRENTLELAADDLPAERCDRVGLTPDEARGASGRQSIAFANFLAELEAGGGPVRVELVPLGNLRPRTPYPVPDARTTAGEWNAIARANHRVDVRLVADAPPPAG